MSQNDTNKKLKKVAQQIASQFEPEKVILFGSWAWGKPRADSDVDLLVIKNTRNTRTLAKEIDSAIFPRPFPLDLVVYRPQDVLARQRGGDEFITTILTRGRVLYASK